MRSDHAEILTIFKLTEIKFKVNEKIVAHIDWKLIGYHKVNNKLFHNSLSKYIDGNALERRRGDGSGITESGETV